MVVNLSAFCRGWLAALLVACGACTYAVAAPTLLSITVTPSNPKVAPGAKLPFTATGQYSEGSSKDLTFTATWSSSSVAVATVSNQAGSIGVANGLNAGSANISASFAGVSGLTGLTVAATSVLVIPKVTPVTFGSSVQFTANATVHWYVDNVLNGNSTVGTISSTGLFKPPALRGTHQIRAVNTSNNNSFGTALVTVTNYAGTLTRHNSNLRQGQNTQETLLSPWNVNVNTFGKLFTYGVDGQVYAQPLYVANLAIAGGTHNVVFVATEHDGVYAFDADGTRTIPFWSRTFIDPQNGITTVPNSDVSCLNISPEYGITGTPVIDRPSGTLYVVAKTKENGVYVQRLHALDIANKGAEKFGGPVTIQVSVPGTGVGSVGGMVSFDALRHNQRTGLLLLNGTVYIAWGSHCDMENYHGWILGYSASTLAQTAKFNVTPNGQQGGIWQMGGGLAADSSGNIFLETGNGTFDSNTGGQDYGTAVIKFTTTAGLHVGDYFAPQNESQLNNNDWDMSSSGIVLLPDQNTPTHQHLLLAGGKTGFLYLIDRDSLGEFNATDQVVQEFRAGVASTDCCDAGFWSTPAFWKQTIFTAGKKDTIKAFRISNGKLITTPASQGSAVLPGGPVAISANGSNNGIAWFLDRDANMLRAYDAGNLANELYDTSKNSTRDSPGTVVKYTEVTVANGRVYIGTRNSLVAYGPLP